MKKATFAPAYVTLFPHLSDIAQKHGYALCVHGSLQTDFDLVAIPWVEEAKPPEELRDELAKFLTIHLSGYGDGVFGTGIDETPSVKPHGRFGWNLYIGAGSKIDLSFMPRVIKS